MRKSDRQSLRWRETHDRSERGRAITIEHMEGGNIGREGIARQLATIKKPVEKLSRARCLGGPLFAFLGLLFNVVILIWMLLGIRFIRPRPDGVINRFQAIFGHTGKQVFAIFR